MSHQMEAFNSIFNTPPSIIIVYTDGFFKDVQLTPLLAPTILRNAIKHEAQYALDHKTHAADILITLADALTAAENEVR